MSLSPLTPDHGPATPPPAPQSVEWSDPHRREAFETWLASVDAGRGLDAAAVEPASADASFRRYLRVPLRSSPGTSLIIMDAPPPLEDVRPFVTLARRMEEQGLPGPRVLAAQEELGFLLLDDLGRQPLLGVLQAEPEQADARMRQVGELLVQWQMALQGQPLPAFDEAMLRRELELFPDWCVAREHRMDWSPAQRQTWERVCRVLIDSALAQPVVTVHRDWMPRNFMVQGQRLSILDFQDAVIGPVTYDAASMLRDAFISWDEERQIDWAVRYWERARRAGVPVQDDFGEFWRALEWMGLQRHLKVLGIFCRLKHRDGKPRYAQDLPRFFAYATHVALRYRELAPLMSLIEPLSGFRSEEGFTLR